MSLQNSIQTQSMLSKAWTSDRKVIWDDGAISTNTLILTLMGPYENWYWMQLKGLYLLLRENNKVVIIISLSLKLSCNCWVWLCNLIKAANHTVPCE